MPERPLPMGWAEAEARGLPQDAGTPEEEMETTARPQPPREELRRWVRGGRYVRVCEEDRKENRFTVRCGLLAKPSSDEVKIWCVHYQDALRQARRVMGLGGY